MNTSVSRTPKQRLAKQLEDLEVPFVDDFPTALKSADHVVDAIFGSLTPRPELCRTTFQPFWSREQNVLRWAPSDTDSTFPVPC